MNSSENNHHHHEQGAFMAWCTVIGCIFGFAIGHFTGRWLVVTIGTGTLGLIIGALIDRSRR